jgi:hypothetical protein
MVVFLNVREVEAGLLIDVAGGEELGLGPEGDFAITGGAGGVEVLDELGGDLGDEGFEALGLRGGGSPSRCRRGDGRGG